MLISAFLLTFEDNYVLKKNARHISTFPNFWASKLLLSQWNINAQICYAVNNFSFYSFHSDDAFCVLLPKVNAHEFKSFSAVQIYDLSTFKRKALGTRLMFICVLCTCHDNIILSSDSGDIYQRNVVLWQ